MSFEPQRTRDLQKIHVAKRQMALDDHTYRCLIERVTGLTSAADLDGRQRRAVIDEFYRLGWKAKTHRKPGQVAERKQALVSKIEALLAEAGRAWAYADGIAQRVCKVETVRFCTEDQLRKIIAALMYDQKRRQKRAASETAP